VCLGKIAKLIQIRWQAKSFLSFYPISNLAKTGWDCLIINDELTEVKQLKSHFRFYYVDWWEIQFWSINSGISVIKKRISGLRFVKNC
jgi:hypothetical protein